MKLTVFRLNSLYYERLLIFEHFGQMNIDFVLKNPLEKNQFLRIFFFLKVLPLYVLLKNVIFHYKIYISSLDCSTFDKLYDLGVKL